MNDLAEQVFEQATMLQKRYMDGFKAGQNSIINKELLEACKNLVFTASKLWDDVKCIKDTKAMIVTHPMIEEARQAIAKAEQGEHGISRI